VCFCITVRDGYATRFNAAEVMSTGRKSRGSRAMKLRPGDEMADIDVVDEIGAGGDTSADAGRASGEDSSDKQYLLAVTKKGYGKRIEVDEFRISRRGGMGVIAIKFKKKAGGGLVEYRRLNTLVSDPSSEDDGEGALAKPKSSKGGGRGGKARAAQEFDSLRCMRVCRGDDEVVFSTTKGTVIRQRVADISIQSRAATGVLLQKLDVNDEVMTVDIISGEGGGSPCEEEESPLIEQKTTPHDGPVVVKVESDNNVVTAAVPSRRARKQKGVENVKYSNPVVFDSGEDDKKD